ncbi:MAG: DegV family protein, partial [Oscillospiraceae bacterium]
MPRPVCITYDSTCDLTPALLERFQIRTVPLTIQTGERIFPDDGHYTSEDLYADFHRDGTLPKTAAVSPEQFKEFFGAILAEGFDIVHIDISADLSGTCQNALIAA